MYFFDYCNKCKGQFRKNKFSSEVYEKSISHVNIKLSEPFILTRTQRTDAYK